MLKDDTTLSTKIPPNMIHVFQRLDLTINKFVKDFMKGMFSTSFTRQISRGLENGVELNDIEVDYRLSVLKPLHAKWLVEYVIICPPTRGKKLLSVVGTGIFDAIKLSSSGLPSLDPFADICPLIKSLQL